MNEKSGVCSSTGKYVWNNYWWTICYSITLNDALGSIGQYTGHKAKTVKAAHSKFDKFNELIKLAGKDEDLTYRNPEKITEIFKF